MSGFCYLCVERPPPGDLRSHLMYHHLIENDEALPSIIGLSRKASIETQTTVTWVCEFEYYDNRKRPNSEINSTVDNKLVMKSNDAVGKFQRQKIIQSSKRNRRYPNHIPPIPLKKRQNLAWGNASSTEHIHKEIEESFTCTNEDQVSISKTHDEYEYPRDIVEPTSNLLLNTIEIKEIGNNKTKENRLDRIDNISQLYNPTLPLDSTQDMVVESNIISTQSRESKEKENKNEDKSRLTDLNALENITERRLDNDTNITVDSTIVSPEEVLDEKKTTNIHDSIEDINNQNIQNPTEDVEVRSEVPRAEEGFVGQQSLLENLMSQGSLSIIKPSGEDGSEVSDLIEHKQENLTSETEDISLKINNLGNSISITRIPSIVQKTIENVVGSNGITDFDKEFYSDEESEEENE